MPENNFEESPLEDGEFHKLFLDDDKFESEETALLCCFLRDIKLLKRQGKTIHDYQFNDPKTAVMYRCILGMAERGAKELSSQETASWMKKYLDGEEYSYEGLVKYVDDVRNNDKDPEFYEIARKFWENWRLRTLYKRYQEVLNNKKSTSDPEVFDKMQELLDFRTKPNPFNSACKTAKESLDKTFGILHSIWSGNEEFPKIRSTYPELDVLLDRGFDLGSLVVIGGATGHGKSVVAMNMAAEMSKVGTKVLFISLEESYRDLSLKVICSQSGVPRKILLDKDVITPKQQQRAHEVMRHFSKDEKSLQWTCGGKTAEEILHVIRTHHEKDGVKVFFVDYLQRIRLEQDNRPAEVSRFALALGELARDLGILIIGTSQLAREGRKTMNKRKPTTYDLSESSFIECEAAYIMTLFRQDMVPGYEETDDYNPEDDGTVEIIMCKSRNGQTGSVKLWFSW